jgi:hypothetical protein
MRYIEEEYDYDSYDNVEIVPYQDEQEENPLTYMELYEEIKVYLSNVFIGDVILNNLNCCDLSMYINRKEDIEWVDSKKEYMSEKRIECSNDRWEDEYIDDIRNIKSIIDRYSRKNNLNRRESRRDDKNLLDFIYSYSSSD